MSLLSFYNSINGLINFESLLIFLTHSNFENANLLFTLKFDKLIELLDILKDFGENRYCQNYNKSLIKFFNDVLPASCTAIILADE